MPELSAKNALDLLLYESDEDERLRIYRRAIPKLTLEALDRYDEDRIRPGSFTTAVLENNLSEAVSQADAWNVLALPVIVYYVQEKLPAGCHGSPEIVEKWTYGKHKAPF